MNRTITIQLAGSIKGSRLPNDFPGVGFPPLPPSIMTHVAKRSSFSIIGLNITAIVLLSLLMMTTH